MTLIWLKTKIHVFVNMVKDNGYTLFYLEKKYFNKWFVYWMHVFVFHIILQTPPRRKVAISEFVFSDDLWLWNPAATYWKHARRKLIEFYLLCIISFYPHWSAAVYLSSKYSYSLVLLLPGMLSNIFPFNHHYFALPAPEFHFVLVEVEVIYLTLNVLEKNRHLLNLKGITIGI